MIFRDRAQAGRALAERVAARPLGPDPIVLALPRGGVPVAVEVARRLGAPLDVFVVRKLGVPGHEELAMGAIATGGIVVLGRDVIDALDIDEPTIERAIASERRELDRRERAYRDAPPLAVAGRSVVLVDDGLATGATMLAAIAAARKLGPARVTVAVPVASSQAREQVGAAADDVVCLATPHPFSGVGLWYDDFSQTTDDEVRALLASERAATAP